MPIRIARYADLDKIAEVLGAAFQEEKFHRYIYPYQDEHPKDYLSAWRKIVEEKYWDYHNIFLVSFVDSSDENQINGASIWRRSGEGTERLWGLNGPWDPRLLILPVVKNFHALQSRLYTNKAERSASTLDPHPLTHSSFASMIRPFISHLFSEPEHRRNHWELALLGVLPEWHDHGVGRALVKHGLDRASVEGLPAVVVSSLNAEGFYQKLGFRIPGGSVSQEDRVIREIDAKGQVSTKTLMNPLKQRGIEGGAIFWTK